MLFEQLDNNEDCDVVNNLVIGVKDVYLVAEVAVR